MKSRQRKPLTEGSIPKALVGLSIPILIAMGFQTLFALTDLFFVGRLGGKAVAGLSISLNAFFVVLMIGHSIGVGGLALISQAWGREQFSEARHTFTQIIGMVWVIGALVWAFAYITTPSYVHFFTDDPETFALGSAYFSVYSATFFLNLFLMSSSFCFRGAGDFITPMAIMLTSVILNIALDPLLIFGIGPFPQLGIRGAAIASVFSQSIAASVLLYFVLGRKKRLYFEQWRPNLETLRKVVKIGLPSGAQYLILALFILLTYRAIRPFGPFATAAVGVGFRLLHASYLPMVSFSAATSTLVGQNYGAGILQRSITAYGWGQRLANGWGVVITTLFLLVPALFISPFAKDPEVVANGALYLRIFGLSNFLAPTIFIVTAAFQGMGKTITPLIGSTMKIALFAALLLLLPLANMYSLKSIFAAAFIGMVAEFVWDYFAARRVFTALRQQQVPSEPAAAAAQS